MGDARDNNLDGKVMDFESFSLKYFFFFFEFRIVDVIQLI